MWGNPRPGGINEKILLLPRASVLFTPVISRICLLEFQRNALKGLGNVVYSPDEVESYINGLIHPILDGILQLIPLLVDIATKL